MTAKADMSPQERERHEATRHMVREFRKQLKTARSTTERRALKLAIRSWLATLEPIQSPAK